MPTKLELLIAQIVVKAGADDGCSSIPSELIAAAAKAAPQLSPEDIAKFPAMWYPTYSAKAAGAPKLKDGWGRLWFEALVELLYQSGLDGLPTLFEFLDRDTKTYHGLVVVRLLRLAAGNFRKKEILEKLKARLPELDRRGGPESVDETMLWASYGDQRLTKLLKSMAKLKIQAAGDETVGSKMKEWAESHAVYL